MKTKEELNALKEEAETVNKKLAELTEEEVSQVTGGGGSIMITLGSVIGRCPNCGHALVCHIINTDQIATDFRCSRYGFKNPGVYPLEEARKKYGSK